MEHVLLDAVGGPPANTDNDDDEEGADYSSGIMNRSANLAENESLLEQFNDSTERDIEDVVELVRKRFHLVGGRIRLLLSDIYSLRSLRLLVERAVDQFKPELVASLDTVDIRGYEPSIAYSIVPVNVPGGRPVLFAHILFSCQL